MHRSSHRSHASHEGLCGFYNMHKVCNVLKIILKGTKCILYLKPKDNWKEPSYISLGPALAWTSRHTSTFHFVSDRGKY